MTINEMVKEAHRCAVEHGWWDDERSVPECLALIHSEVSEALEDYRNGLMGAIYAGDKPCGFPSEMADVLIRGADLCGRLGIDLEAAVAEKMAYNETRPYRHGGKRT